MFSSTVMDHFYRPRKVGCLEAPGVLGQVGSVREGRWIQIFLQLVGDRIAVARFQSYGCVPAIAAGSCLAEWVEGRTVDEARALTPQDLVEQLGGLPPERAFCASMAVQALHNALDEATRGLTPAPGGAL